MRCTLDTCPFAMRSASSSSGSCRSAAAVRWGVKGRPSRFAPGSQASWHGRFPFHVKANAEWLRWASQPALPRHFNAPIAAITFTLEEIIGDLDQTMLSGVIVAAAIAAAVERGILGQHPVFEIQRQYSLGHASSLVWYAVLGVLSAVAAVTFTDSLLGLRNRFKNFTSVPKWVHPAVGGALTGGLAAVALLWLKQNGITGGGYKTLSQALAGSLSVKVMIALCLLKLAATVCSYSSGGAGGIFAPSLFIGGMLGGAVGYVDVTVLHHSSDSIGAFALVGMGAVFAGIIRAPMTSVLIIFEMTGSYGLILPLMIANMSAYGLARHWRSRPRLRSLAAARWCHPASWATGDARPFRARTAW